MGLSINLCDFICVFQRFVLSNVWHNKNLCIINLCDLRLTCIIRINKFHAEICCFMVYCLASLSNHGFVIIRLITVAAINEHILNPDIVKHNNPKQTYSTCLIANDEILQPQQGFFLDNLIRGEGSKLGFPKIVGWTCFMHAEENSDRCSMQVWQQTCN